MEAIDELVQLSESIRQATALLADEDVDDDLKSSSSRRASTFLDVVALGNVVSLCFLIGMSSSCSLGLYADSPVYCTR